MRSGGERIERLVLDTSAYSQIRYGHAGVLDLVAASVIVLVPTVVLGELEAGFVGGQRSADNRRVLADFLDEPFVAVLDVTRSVAQRYGETFGQLRQAGTPMSTNDIWIAAAALDCGGHLATFDRDFERVSGLSLTVLS